MLYLTVGIDSQNRFVKYPKVSEKKNLMEGKCTLGYQGFGWPTKSDGHKYHRKITLESRRLHQQRGSKFSTQELEDVYCTGDMRCFERMLLQVISFHEMSK